MARDPLRILQAVRRREVEQARQALASCLLAEAAAADRISAIDDAVRLDREANRKIDDAHWFLDMFALRLANMHAKRRDIIADWAAAQGRSAEARGAVVAARTAAESVETLIAERLSEAKLEAGRREQHALDDISRARSNIVLQPAEVGKVDTF